MSDIASLGIKVTTEGVTKAERDLDKLASSGSKAEQQADKTAKAMQSTAKSAKELQFAARGLPAQFTDIATSLSSGQRPLQVLLQQGGQIKDMFGGIGPAARAMGGYIAGLINPATLATVAVVALGAAWKKASDDSAAFNSALIQTGGFAGVAGVELDKLVDKLDRMEGVSRGGATNALTAVAASGRFAGEQFDLVARAAANMEAATGQAIDNTIKKFVDLGREPVDALLKLNESEHFLTQAQLDRVEALRDEGREQDAANEAIRIYAQHLDEVAAKSNAAMPAMSRWWRDIKDEISAAANEVGRYMQLVGQAIDLRAKQIGLEKQGGFTNSVIAALNPNTKLRAFNAFSQDQFNKADGGASLRKMQSDLVSSSLNRTFGNGAVDSSAIKNQEALKQGRERLLATYDKEFALKVEINRINKDAKKFGLDELQTEKLIAAARERYAKAKDKSRKTKASPSDEGLGLLGQIRQQIALNEAASKSKDKLSTSEQLRIRIVERLNDARMKTTKGTRDAIAAALAELDASDKAAQAAQREVEAKKALTALTNDLAQAEENRRQANRIDLISLAGGGRQEVERQRRRLDIEREYTEEVRQLRDRAASQNREVLKAEEDALRDSLSKRLQEEESYQRQRSAMMSDWRNGARAAAADFVDNANDVAGNTYTIFSNAVDGMSNVFTDFLTKGKGDWRGFFDDLHAQITSFVVKQQLAKGLKKFAPKLFGEDGGDSASQLTTAAGALAGSAAPLMAAATALSASAAALAAAGAGGSLSSSGSGGSWLNSLFSSGGGGWGAFTPNQPGFASGGFTGGRRNRVAGIVHGEEYVLNADSVRSLGTDYLDRLNAGGASAIASGPTYLTQQFTQVVQGRMDGTTAEQAARASGREAARGLARTGR